MRLASVGLSSKEITHSGRRGRPSVITPDVIDVIRELAPGAYSQGDRGEDRHQPQHPVRAHARERGLARSAGEPGQGLDDGSVAVLRGDSRGELGVENMNRRTSCIHRKYSSGCDRPRSAGSGRARRTRSGNSAGRMSCARAHSRTPRLRRRTFTRARGRSRAAAEASSHGFAVAPLSQVVRFAALQQHQLLPLSRHPQRSGSVRRDS